MKEQGFAILAILIIGAALSYVTMIAADRTVKYMERERPRDEVEFRNFQLKKDKGLDI